ncbi:hypothetical protein PGQ11_010909 [Apiospora arundinis]|uniref:Thaumatin-like protein n=1 Tax=Apiospora arundinis TaxID=335852 RepID=A0ABR2HYJ0_9PEZI
MSNRSLLLSLLASIRVASAAVLRWPARSPMLNQNEPYRSGALGCACVDTCTVTVTATVTALDQSSPISTATSVQTAASVAMTAPAPSSPSTAISAQAAGVTAPPALLTISLVNSYSAAISTTHNSNAGAPPPVSGPTTPGTLAAGATAAIAVPTDWAGIISVNDAKYPASDGNSLVEANYQNRTVEGYAIADVDVSYVNGFTLPITCSCNDIGVTGCNKNLFLLSACPATAKQHGSCINPLRSDKGAFAANAFFAPCQNAAYTYPNDNSANSQNECQNGQIVCCVGASCPPSYKQGHD